MYLDNIPSQNQTFEVIVSQNVIIFLDGLLAMVQQTQPMATRDNVIDFVLTKLLIDKGLPKAVLTLLKDYQKQNTAVLYLNYFSTQKTSLPLSLDDTLIAHLNELLVFVQLTQNQVTMDTLIEHIFLTISSPCPESSTAQITQLVAHAQKHKKQVQSEKRKQARAARAKKATAPKPKLTPERQRQLEEEARQKTQSA